MHNISSTQKMQKSSPPSASTAGAHRVALVGARGYSGLELARLLLKHPEAQLAGCFSADPTFHLGHYLPEEAAQQVPTWSMHEFTDKMTDKLTGKSTGKNTDTLNGKLADNLKNKLQGIDVVFLATPAEVSAELAPVALRNNVHVIDLSGAFRLKQGSPQNLTEKYQTWYGMKHPAHCRPV